MNPEGDEARTDFDSEIDRLQAEGHLKEQINPADREKLFQLFSAQSECGPEQFIDGEMPHLHSPRTRQDIAREKREYRKRERIAEFAPEIKVAGAASPWGPHDVKATAKQINYLRNLGLRDETFLSTLSKKQASTAIEQALHVREGTAPNPSQKSGCLGILLAVAVPCGIIGYAITKLP